MKPEQQKLTFYNYRPSYWYIFLSLFQNRNLHRLQKMMYDKQMNFMGGFDANHIASNSPFYCSADKIKFLNFFLIIHPSKAIKPQRQKRLLERI